jgi:hypothetical protein
MILNRIPKNLGTTTISMKINRKKTEEIFEATMTGNFPKLVIDTTDPGSS